MCYAFSIFDGKQSCMVVSPTLLCRGDQLDYTEAVKLRWVRQYDRKILEEPDQEGAERVLHNVVLRFNDEQSIVTFLPVHRMQLSKRGKGLR